MPGLWSMDRISSRLGPWEPLEPKDKDENTPTGEKEPAPVTTERQDRSDRKTLRNTILQMMECHPTLEDMLNTLGSTDSSANGEDAPPSDSDEQTAPSSLEQSTPNTGVPRQIPTHHE